jgi:hypothetical protein
MAINRKQFLAEDAEGSDRSLVWATVQAEEGELSVLPDNRTGYLAEAIPLEI